MSTDRLRDGAVRARCVRLDRASRFANVCILQHVESMIAAQCTLTHDANRLFSLTLIEHNHAKHMPTVLVRVSLRAAS